MTVNAHLGLECDECGAQVVPGLWKVGDDCRHCPGHIRVPPSSASVPPELPTLSDEEMDAMKRSGLYAHGDARVARLLERAIALRAEVARLTEWKEAILGALEARQEFREGEWAGDKRGWGYVFEFINWLFRDRDALRAEVAALSDDRALLDWMQEHGASVEVADDECLPCIVQASDDYELEGSSPHYDIRAAIRAARSASGEATK